MPPRTTFRTGCPGATRTRDPRLRTTVLCSTELRDRSNRARACAPKWSGWLDSNQRPPASEAGTLAELSYTLLALRREIESLSPDRQSGRLTRCVTERDRISSSAGKGTWCVWAETAKCRENARTFSRHSPGLGLEGPGYCSGLARRAEESVMSVSIGRTTATSSRWCCSRYSSWACRSSAAVSPVRACR